MESIPSEPTAKKIQIVSKSLCHMHPFFRGPICNEAYEYTFSVSEEASIPELPVDVQGLIWELVKIEVRTRLKARLWKEVHDQIKRGFFFIRPNTTLPIPEGRFHVFMCEPIRTAFTEEGSTGIGSTFWNDIDVGGLSMALMAWFRNGIDDNGNAPTISNT
jgi:hypothetical protein